MEKRKYAYIVLETDGQCTLCYQDEPEISLQKIHDIIGAEFLDIVRTNSVPPFVMALNDEGIRLGLPRNHIASVLYHNPICDIRGNVVIGIEWCDEREDIEPDFYAMPSELASYVYNVLREEFDEYLWMTENGQ